MSQTPPNKPRRRIAGEAKPGDVASAAKPKPAVNLPKAPKRTDPPKPTKPSKRTKAQQTEVPAAAAASETVSSPDSSAARRSRGLSVAALALIILTTAAVVFGISGVVAAVNHYNGDDAALAREDAADAAGAAAETIFTYDWNKLKKHVSDSQATMTPRFAKKFESVSPALTALAPQRRIQMKAVVRHAATVECGDKCAEDKAKVLVFIDQARVADGIKKPTVFGNRMEMSMVLRDGDWLVDDVKAL